MTAGQPVSPGHSRKARTGSWLLPHSRGARRRADGGRGGLGGAAGTPPPPPSLRVRCPPRRPPRTPAPRRRIRAVHDTRRHRRVPDGRPVPRRAGRRPAPGPRPGCCPPRVHGLLDLPHHPGRNRVHQPVLPRGRVADAAGPAPVTGAPPRCLLGNEEGTAVGRAMIGTIRTGARKSRTLGDIAGLAGSIAVDGQRHPVTVSPAGQLITGARRLAAREHLGWVTVPARVITTFQEAVDALNAERADGRHAKPMTVAEIIDLESVMAAELEWWPRQQPGNGDRI